MKKVCNSFFAGKFVDDQSGQVLAWVVVMMMCFMGAAGLVIDGGAAYADHAALQQSANAAALAAAGQAYDTGSSSGAVTIGDTFSATQGDDNSGANFLGTKVTTTVTPTCLNALLPAGATCAQQTSGFVNAVHVLQSNSYKPTFMCFFGMCSMTINAEATATMNGQAEQWNVAIIVDGTGSMSTTDSNCGTTSGTFTEFQCALAGVQQLLGGNGGLNPCPGAGTGCKTTAGQLGTPVFRVSLFTFPNVAYPTFDQNTMSTCGATLTHEPYTFPGASATPGTGNITPTAGYTEVGSPKATYQITPFDYTYYSTSATTGNLNPSDNLVQAIGYGASPNTNKIGTAGCLPNVGGEGTYYAGVLYAAQEALLAEKASYPNSKNAIIMLSDGDATSDATQMDSATKTAGATVSTSHTYPYPSTFDECQQAIQAAQIAYNQGTEVITIAYGAETSGCGVSGTDTTVLSSPSLPNTVNTAYTLSSFLPCISMQNISSPASNGTLANFYSDPNQSASSGLDKTCGSSGSNNVNSAISNLQSIFSAIEAGFTSPKLISNSTT
ncbi:MAG: pilus assembly protein TadG-related protein [Terracidiphilus sp.]